MSVRVRFPSGAHQKTPDKSGMLIVRRLVLDGPEAICIIC